MKTVLPRLVLFGAAMLVPAAAFAQAPTYTKDVAPILFEHCAQCHRPNEVAPMSLMSYDEVRPWARSIKTKITNREMPPWGVGKTTLTFLNERKLSEKEIKTIVAWADGGALKGNDADMPKAPTYPGGWKFNREPDVVVKMPADFVV